MDDRCCATCDHYNADKRVCRSVTPESKHWRREPDSYCVWWFHAVGDNFTPWLLLGVLGGGLVWLVIFLLT